MYKVVGFGRYGGPEGIKEPQSGTANYAAAVLYICMPDTALAREQNE